MVKKASKSQEEREEGQKASEFFCRQVTGAKKPKKEDTFHVLILMDKFP